MPPIFFVLDYDINLPQKQDRWSKVEFLYVDCAVLCDLWLLFDYSSTLQNSELAKTFVCCQARTYNMSHRVNARTPVLVIEDFVFAE